MYSKIDAALSRIDSLNESGTDGKKKIKDLDDRLSFEGDNCPRRTDYSDPDFDAFYLFRYGCAYAFEYSLIYRIILSTFNGRESKKRYGDRDYFGVTSIGCGSMIDAWSLAYAKSKLENNSELLYSGVDYSRWSPKGSWAGYFYEEIKDCFKQKSLNGENSPSDIDKCFSSEGVGMDASEAFTNKQMSTLQRYSTSSRRMRSKERSSI